MTLRPAAAALGALVLAACQGPGATSPAPTPSAPSAPLAAADARMYAGDYEGAEAAYRSLIDSQTPGAGAHYAILLDYESRFREAIEHARAEADRHPDSAALARLTRAYDWSADVPAALATGRRAVETRPVDPLAHVFYSEALSDAGRFQEAEAQLHAAEGSSRDPFVRSEIYREWANYYRDRANRQSELNNMQLSLKAQPHFPERSLELIRYDYAVKKPELAHALLDRNFKSSRSGAVLAAAGDAALVAGDFDTATAYYRAASAAAPELAEPVEALAVIAVANKRNFNEAHDALLAQLRKDPANGSVYEFLWQLDRYVLKKDPAAELSTIAPRGSTALQAARAQALQALNAVRQLAGVTPIAADPALEVAAEEHAWYTIFNLGQQSLAGLGIHAEDASLPGYVGPSSILRDRAAGYGGDRSAEVINHVFTPQAAMGVWEHSVYHRFPLIDAETRSAGYGEVLIGPLAVAVMDVGLGPAATARVVGFPADGQRDVPTAFTGNEIPDPAPQGAEYPTGYPVTLQVGSASGLGVSSGRLIGPDGKEVAAWTLDPNKQLAGGEWCLLPQQPLKPGATYTVDVAGTVDGRAFTKRWTFTTSPSA